ncbi:MAG: hypothetical protein NT022_11000, partial [Deltaproteobacteria bacterium]|nr:hypothetical protein [Deltaproteobacteria bacterium]
MVLWRVGRHEMLQGIAARSFGIFRNARGRRFRDIFLQGRSGVAMKNCNGIVPWIGMSMIFLLSCSVQKGSPPPGALSASFTYSPSSPVVLQAMQFTDTS